MKRFVFVVLAVVAVGQLSARDVVNINRNWEFFSNIETSSDKALTVNLPHTWSNDALSGKQDYYRGIGNYMKNIDIPLTWRNKRVFIRFRGAGTVTDVLVNGRHVGEHRGGYTAFTFEITGFLKYGERNQFWAIVNNAPQMDVMPAAGDINIYGGIYRDVELIVTEASHISLTDHSSDGVYLIQKKVTRDRAEVEALVKIDGLSGRNLTLNLTVTTPRGDTVLRQSGRLRVPSSGQGEVRLPFAIDKPNLWNGILNPYMYKVAVEVNDDGLKCDEVAVPLGLRYFIFDPRDGLYLNGELYPLNGVVAYEDRSGVGPAVMSYQIREDIDMITEMGANAVRAAGYPHHPEFYRECDRRGLVVWSDLPFLGPAYFTDRSFVNSAAFRADGRQQLTEMIRQNYNSPSVLMWGLFSNLALSGDNPVEYIRELGELAAKEDPSRMRVASSNQDGDINFITDLIAWTPYFGWLEGQSSDLRIWVDNLRANWGGLRSAVVYGAGASIYHQDDVLTRPDPAGNWHPERWQTYFHEQYHSILDDESIFWGRFVANMFDYGAAGRTWGEGNGINDFGMVTFDRKYRKDAFYFYKANWNRTEPFVYIAERRWEERTAKEQTIKVFSNEGEVELILNGESQDKKEGVNGTYTWDVVLREGVNRIEAHTVSSSDATTLTVNSDKTNHGIK